MVGSRLMSLLVAMMATVAHAASPTWTTMTSSANPATVGQSVTFTATVKVIGGGGPPTGSVTFKDAGAVLGAVALDSAGTAAFSTSALPQGTHPITAVYAGDASFSGSTSEALLQATPAAGPCPPSFFTAARVPMERPERLATGDFNRDGKLDLVVALYFGDITILLGDGVGGFSEAPGSPLRAPLAIVPTSVAVRDFNLDGKLDLAVSMGGGGVYDSNRIVILLGDGNGGFASAPGSPLLVGPNERGLSPSLAAGDFNLDGRPDLAVRHSRDATMVILFGDGNGGFAAAGPAFSAGLLTYNSFLAVADFNLDGRPDLFLGGGTVLLGDGAGGFASAPPIGKGYSPILADFNGDGRLDLAHGDTPFQIETLLGDGSGGFSPAPGSPVAPAGYGVVDQGVSDFNGDGKLDIPIGMQTGLLIGDGLGGFVPTYNVPGLAGFPGALGRLAAGDFNSDGRADFIALYPGSDEDPGIKLVSLISACDKPASTVVVSSAPNPSSAGQSVTLTATVSPASGPGNPTGQVQFFDGDRILGSPVTLAGGVAVTNISTLWDGARSIVAAYSGDVNFAGSSATLTHTVFSRLIVGDASANSATATTLTFNVSLTVASNLSVSVDYATSDRSGKAGIDYTATSGTVTFDPGQTQKTVSVPIPHGTPGPSKDFFLTLSNPSNTTFLYGATAIGTINYSDPGSLTLYIDDPSLKEGNISGGVSLLAFNLSLSKASATSVTVDYATANVTATAGPDYLERSGTVTFLPGKTTRTILIPVFGNTSVNSNRTFFVNLTNVTGGATLARTQGTGTILDDDPAVPAAGSAQFRLYSPSTREHLYTTDTNEYAVLGSLGWLQEGVAYTLFQNAGSSGASFAIPMYRLYHPVIRQHHWTTDANEVTVLAAGAWDYEGISGYILPTQEPGTVPLYRLALASPALHLWTTDANEKLVLSTQRGWIYEGVMGYVVP